MSLQSYADQNAYIRQCTAGLNTYNFWILEMSTSVIELQPLRKTQPHIQTR